MRLGPASPQVSHCVKVERGNAVAQFRREHPCPGRGADAGSTSRCAGYQIHHILPLACSDPDSLDNLVWLTTEQHHRLHRAMVCRCGVVGSENGDW